MAIGNDVVDLGDAAIAAAPLRERYVRRVLTDAECARLEKAADPKALFWAHFAAKEATYKAVAQVRPAPGFAHRRFLVAEDLASVRFDDLVLSSKVEVSAERVHAVAWLGEAPELAAVACIGDGADPGVAARTALCAALSERLGCALSELAVVRDAVPGSWDGYGPPRVEREGRPVPASVSLSHDGRFVAYAATSGRASRPSPGRCGAAGRRAPSAARTRPW